MSYRSNRFSGKSTALACLFLLAAAGESLAQDPARERMRASIERLRSSGELRIGKASIAAVLLIPELYERRSFALAWTDGAKRDEALRAIRQARNDGLDPADYHIEELERLLNEAGGGQARRVDLDLLLTDGVVRLGYHLRFGKVDPYDLDPDWNLSREFGGRDPVEVIGAVLDAPSLVPFIDGGISGHFYYQRMKSALAGYREIAGAGGWPKIPQGPSPKVGMRDARVALLRQRLAATGDLERDGNGAGDLYDERLKAAVVRFQDRHGLGTDGVVGKQTLEAMNVPVEARIDQIRVNLERTRWVFQDVEDDFIVTNIAGFRVFRVSSGKIAWTTRAQVGKPYRRTPVFKAKMKYLVLNPTWTVPPGILSRDILPAVRKDPGYLQRKGLAVLDRNGKEVDPATIDWSSVTARGFPYQLRQGPGPNNALGQVKFIFPNEHFVFLHDTPSRELFERPDRSFSSGCIRVESPLDLAVQLLADQPEWDRARIDRVIQSGNTQTVFLSKPLTVFLLYWTVGVDLQDTIRFMKDVYERDRAVLEALEGEFVYSPPTDAGRFRPQGVQNE